MMNEEKIHKRGARNGSSSRAGELRICISMNMKLLIVCACYDAYLVTFWTRWTLLDNKEKQ